MIDIKTIIKNGENENVEFKSSLKFVKTYMMVSYEFNGEIQRVEKWDYPIKALREAILNAVLHRDYQEPSDIQIKVYDDKISIASPGKLYGDMTLKKLQNNNYQSSLRNKLVAEAFYLTGNIEKYGTGFLRIKNELKQYSNIAYEFKEIANAMQIVFYKTIKDNGTINEVYEFIEKNPNSSAVFISEELGISLRTLKRKIKELVMQEKVEYNGSKKMGGYYIKVINNV